MNITEILLKVTLNTITLTLTHPTYFINFDFIFLARQRFILETQQTIPEITIFQNLLFLYSRFSFAKKKNIIIIIPPLHRRRGILFYLCPSKIFFVIFFSATIDGRNLIFGHKFHIGMPYCGKCFWTRQIPTSCLPT